MKVKRFFLILASGLACAACNLPIIEDVITEIPIGSGSKFEKTFTEYGPGKQIQQLKEGGYLIAGTNFTSGKSDIYLLKLKGTGEIENQKVYPTANNDGVEDMIQLSDGTIAMVGYSFNSVKNNLDLLYMRVDPNTLNTVGSPVILSLGSNTESETAKSIIELNDGKVLIVGSVYSGTGSDVYAIKVNTDGNNFAFNKKIPVAEWETANDAVEIADGYILVGETRVNNSAQPDAMIMKLNLSGDLVSGYPKKHGGASDYDVFNSVTLASNQLFMAGTSSAAGDNDLNFCKTDINGVALSGFPRQIRSNGTPEEGLEIRNAGSNKFLISGFRGEDAYMVVTDANGVPTSLNKAYVAIGSQAFFSGLNTSDSGFGFVGSQGQFLYFVKTDKDGKF